MKVQYQADSKSFKVEFDQKRINNWPWPVARVGMSEVYKDLKMAVG